MTLERIDSERACYVTDPALTDMVLDLFAHHGAAA
jgi:hypothetical protein